jgi:hypothetical protein
VRRVVAMSPCRLAYNSILQFELSDNVTSRQHVARQRVVLRAALDKTTARQRSVLRFVVLSLAPTRRTKAYQISHHTILYDVAKKLVSTG